MRRSIGNVAKMQYLLSTLSGEPLVHQLVQLTSPHGTTHVLRALLDSGSVFDSPSTLLSFWIFVASLPHTPLSISLRSPPATTLFKIAYHQFHNWTSQMSRTTACNTGSSSKPFNSEPASSPTTVQVDPSLHKPQDRGLHVDPYNFIPSPSASCQSYHHSTGIRRCNTCGHS
ncbi:hypothetical protein J6590_081386 [Homalodisca vitripennis]|nr:hypothetical protein J6590_081386 [Homalodisca vitripennis]